MKQAFEEASKMPEVDQEAFAEFLLAELQDDREWRARFSSRPDVLSKLADEARADHESGRTRPFDDLFKRGQ